MYLAIVSTNLDDVPILLTPHRDAARIALENCTRDDLDAACKVLGRDAAGFCCATILRFDANGKLAEFIDGPETPQLED
ncbi:MAG: hypothetical protein ACYTEX_26090 [Planctomycetota bacterium]